MALGIMTISGLSFAPQAEASGYDHCEYYFPNSGHGIEEVSGFLFEATAPAFSYSWGTGCSTDPFDYDELPTVNGERTIVPQNGSVSVKYTVNGGSSSDGIMVYLRKKDSSGNWVNVSHWGETANTGGYVQRIIQRQYGDIPLDPYENYYLLFYNADGASTMTVGFARPYDNYFRYSTSDVYGNVNIYAHYH